MISIGTAWETARSELVGSLFVGLLMVSLLRLWWRRRRPKRYYGQTMRDAVQSADEPGEVDAPEKMSLAKRLFAVTFFSVWLTVWTAGCYMAGRAWLGLSWGDEGYIFLLIWLTLAIPAWFIVFAVLLRLLKGEDVELSFDGDADGGD